jgi:hypothetical protein
VPEWAEHSFIYSLVINGAVKIKGNPATRRYLLYDALCTLLQQWESGALISYEILSN